MDGLPKIALRDFYKSDDFKAVHSVWKSEEVEKLLNFIAPDETSNCVAVFESTGTYSYFWKQQFRARGITVLVADRGMVKSTRRSLGGTDNKDDAFDALVMVALYVRHYLEIYDRRFWVSDRPTEIKQIKRCLLDLKTTVKKQTAFINTVKSRLAFEYPARAKIQSKRHGELEPDSPPGFWAWLAGRGDMISANPRSRFENHYTKEVKADRANVSSLTRQFAAQICDLHSSKAVIQNQLVELLKLEDFVKYHEVFERFGFGPIERGWILSRIFPFDSFLCMPKKAALRRFRQACGLGKVEKSSGQIAAGKGGGKWTGCSNTRSVLWTYCYTRIEPNKNKSYSPLQQELKQFFLERSRDARGAKKRGRNLADARNATCRKLADLVFRELHQALK
ncbi:MAG: transposase [Microcoleus sp. PH2017_10_PVI_O_A]|uniref:IS110 family transposase n=1 Tax=unclassified Microcoleus TaxID=2642155 RepID=UPI001E168753|nr:MULTISPECIES: IS110 family transposase [unclassified Microcoleus]TAE85645.1 MAG: transposase [Oscillatoriales cyanobacterium]MCC3405024.1 transposase [Microcoleus sp. PH2017_10_PVI_O_A]MCC3459104.1 transposase [Microcoleus sp. PH2017_11_PCY_U_A]MCC3477161.1 transposase [Microcoleus sp. PH2017_12_PCY_D_A]MCC3527720.1 transposase [Microcoleus sp. PH2017_21_RUC_O_A]